MKDEIRKWVYAQIERWGQDNFESAESWARNVNDSNEAETYRVQFVKAKKKEFEELLKGLE